MNTVTFTLLAITVPWEAPPGRITCLLLSRNDELQHLWAKAQIFLKFPYRCFQITILSESKATPHCLIMNQQLCLDRSSPHVSCFPLVLLCTADTEKYKIGEIWNKSSFVEMNYVNMNSLSTLYLSAVTCMNNCKTTNTMTEYQATNKHEHICNQW